MLQVNRNQKSTHRSLKSSEKTKFTIKACFADNKAVAFVEFAFIAPLFLVVGIVGLETIHFAAIHQTLNQTAALVADSASRTRTAVDESDINDIFFGAETSSSSADIGENGRVILSMLTHNNETGSREGNWIRWQRCYGELGSGEGLQSSFGVEGDGENDSSLAAGIGEPSNRIAATVESPINFVEIIYDYTPIFDIPLTRSIISGQRLRFTAAYTVRERSDQAITNVTSIGTSDRWTCNLYNQFP